MIIFYDNNGRVVQTSDPTIYQGDSAVGRICVVSPYPNNTALTASFTLPNGNVTQEYAFATDISATGEDLGSFRPIVYKLTAPASVFSIKSGMVRVQIYAYTPIGGGTVNSLDASTWSERKALDPTSFSVIQGNYILPSEEPSSKWDSVLLAYSDLAAKVVDLLSKYGLSIYIYNGVVSNNPIEGETYIYKDALTTYYEGRSYLRGQLIIDQLSNLYVCIANKSNITSPDVSVANAVQYVMSVRGKPRVEIVTITNWTSLPTTNNEPYLYKGTAELSTPLFQKSYIELFNDNAVAFAKYGYAIASVNEQTIEVWAVVEPPESVILTIGIGEVQ